MAPYLGVEYEMKSTLVKNLSYRAQPDLAPNYAWTRIVKRSEARAQPDLSQIIGEPSKSSNGVGGLIVTSEGNSYGIINNGPTTECLEWIREPITNQWKCELFSID